MYEKWKSMTVQELMAELNRWIRRAEEHGEAYNEAVRTKDPRVDLPEMNQEVVEQWMVVGTLKQLIAERHAQDAKNPPSFPPSQKSISRQELATRLELAKTHIKERNAHLAIAELNITLFSYPRHAESHYYRGLAFAELEKYQLAVEDFTAAIQTQSDMLEAYWARSRAYSHLRQYGPEIQDLTHVLRLSPYDAEAYRDRGLALYLIKQYDKALADLNRALQLTPDDEDAYYFRSGVYMELGDYKRALADCEYCLKLRPRHKLPEYRIKEIQKKMADH